MRTPVSSELTTPACILNNEIYIGRRIFNRRTWIEVPHETRGFTRRPKLNSQSEWIIRDEPDPRIIPQELSDRVKARQALARAARDPHFGATGRKLDGGRADTYLLLGIVECGACGKPYLSRGGGRWRCKGTRSGHCDNGSISTAELEGRALAGLRDRLLTPEIITRFAALLQDELRTEYRHATKGRTEQEARLASTCTRIARLVSQVEDGDGSRSLTRRLAELEQEQLDLEAALATTTQMPVIRLPANYTEVYHRAIAELGEHLAAPDAVLARAVLRTSSAKL